MGTSRFLRSKQPLLSPTLLALCILLQFIALCAADDAPESTITEAPIFLPHYDKESWSVVRGSIVGINETASETTYTIFCPPETTPACGLALDFPFVIVEGPSTVVFHGTATSFLTANLECALDNTTAATCSGYTSFKPGFSNGGHTTQATETSWTSTYSGTGVEWGTLTMAPVPTATTEPLGMTLTNMGPSFSGDVNYIPSPSNSGLRVAIQDDMRWFLVAIVSMLVATGILV